MHVAVITNALFQSDGIATSSQQIAAGLIDAGNDVTLVYPERDYDQPRLPEWPALGARVVAVPELSIRRRRPLRTARGFLTTVRRIRQLDADVLHVHQPSHAALASLAARRRPTKVVCHLRGAAPERPGVAQRIGLRRADIIIPVSAATGRSWEPHGADPAKVTVVYNGIDLAAYPAVTPLQRADARAALGVPENVTIVGFVGRFTEAKGIFVLAKAFSRLASERDGLWLVCVGGTDAQAGQRARLERMLEGANVRLLDAVADTRPVIAAFDVGVVPSDSEAFSRVVLELMSTGVPVCGSAVGGTPEALGPELADRLTDFGDVDALTAEIARVIDDPEPDALRRAFRARAERFELGASVQRNVEILTESAD